MGGGGGRCTWGRKWLYDSENCVDSIEIELFSKIMMIFCCQLSNVVVDSE